MYSTFLPDASDTQAHETHKDTQEILLRINVLLIGFDPPESLSFLAFVRFSRHFMAGAPATS